MPVVFGKCIKEMSNLNVFSPIQHQANYSGCYTDLLFSILYVFLFSENNRQFGTYYFCSC